MTLVKNIYKERIDFCLLNDVFDDIINFYGALLNHVLRGEGGRPIE
jgi:hypothetical protein